MKKNILFTIFLSIFYFNSFSQTEEVKEYYPNGSVKTISTYKNNMLNGLQKIYDENGDLKNEIHYLNNLKEGSYKFYHNNIVLRHSEYKNDKENGTSKIFSDDGKVTSVENWKNGILVIDGTLKNSPKYYTNDELDFVVLGITEDQYTTAFKDKKGIWVLYTVMPEFKFKPFTEFATTEELSQKISTMNLVISMHFSLEEFLRSNNPVVDWFGPMDWFDPLVFNFNNRAKTNSKLELELEKIPLFNTSKDFIIAINTIYDSKNATSELEDSYVTDISFSTKNYKNTVRTAIRVDDIKKPEYYIYNYSKNYINDIEISKNDKLTENIQKDKILRFDRIGKKVLISYDNKMIYNFDYDLNPEIITRKFLTNRTSGILILKQEIGTEIEKNTTTSEWVGNGSGVIISKTGHIATNYHVINNASKIEVEFKYKGEIKSFNAEVVQSDIANDLSILKINDPKFNDLTTIPYTFKVRVADVGTEVFALGYPMALSIMGKEIKFTDGKISSKTGYQGDITTYQTTTPIQPGSSGGPLFDYKGNLIGINSSGLSKNIADNVSYTIKSNYLLNLIDVLSQKIELPTSTILSDKPLTEQIKILSDYVVLIKVK